MNPASVTGTRTRSGGRLALALLAGAAVAVGLGVYGRLHPASGRAPFLLGFSSMLAMKTWLSTVAVLLVLVQLLTALWMWGKLPGAGRAPAFVAPLHRWSGTLAFVTTLPVAFVCLWGIGLAWVGTGSTRAIVHSLAGCLFYGAYASKMLGLRMKSLPGWALPVLGGAVFTLLVVVWLTSALWFFTSGQPLF